MASAYNTAGTPFNKTAALLELQFNVATINAIIVARIPQTGIMSIPAAAFVPRQSPSYNGEWANFGMWISSTPNSLSEVDFFAAIQLPTGAKITRLISHWRDMGEDHVACYLKRTLNGFGGPKQDLATAHSPHASGSGYGSTVNASISYATIDNTWSYYMKVTIPPNPPSPEYYFEYAIIEYEYST